MRNRVSIAALRCRDGQSLARALAILLLFNLFAAGFHAGAMAASDDPIGVFCGPAGIAAPAGADGSSDHREGCCQFGCVTAISGVAAEVSDALPGLALARLDVAVPGIAWPANGLRPRARAPPVLA